jgi:hypothetical protein
MPQTEIERHFAGLARGGYRVTSPADPAYNCAAWAAGETEVCWDPALTAGGYWPPGVSRVLMLGNLVAAFATLGYEPCQSAEFEPQFEKLAVYADAQGVPTHVARQLPKGTWTSKLGTEEDIEHETLAGLEGAIYGKVVQTLRRLLPLGAGVGHEGNQGGLRTA